MTGGGTWAARLRRAIWAGRELLARALLVIAIVAAIAAPANALETPSPELRRVVSAGDPEWTVVWKATTAEQHGQFRLYGGPALESLQLVDIQPAALGPAGYRYRDERSGVPGWYYQIRYLNSKGEELVLGSLRVDPVGFQSTPASIHQPAPVSKAVPSTGPQFALASHRQPPADDVMVIDNARPEPDVPPPRCSRQDA